MVLWTHPSSLPSQAVCFQTPKGERQGHEAICGPCPAQPAPSAPLTKWPFDVCFQQDFRVARACPVRPSPGAPSSTSAVPGPGSLLGPAAAALRVEENRPLCEVQLCVPGCPALLPGLAPKQWLTAPAALCPRVCGTSGEPVGSREGKVGEGP